MERRNVLSYTQRGSRNKAQRASITMNKMKTVFGKSIPFLLLFTTTTTWYPVSAFLVRRGQHVVCRGRESSCRREDDSSFVLFGISEWRDLDFDLPGKDRQLGINTAPPKSVCLLPFPYQEVLLQGETKQLRLYEDRFIKIFQDVMDNHAGVVGMGLIADSGIIQTVPLCEVEASNTMEGFGIFVTIRVVGRAQLLEIMQQEPYLRAVCMEIADEIPPNLELPNMVGNNIQHLMELLSGMEQRLNQARKNKEIEDEEMDRRITLAKLEDRFYMDEGEDDGGDEEDDGDVDEEDDEAEVFLDRQTRFDKAYNIALTTDAQGYRVTDDTGDRSAQELTAMSWAAFCTNLLPSEESTFRIQALDCNNLFERLKLAAQMLRETKARLRVKMHKAGIKFRGEDLDEDEPTLDSKNDN